ncbi:hypothetical protein F5878DRAFT_663588 [Lentinula raphanica]|uniref:Uncharacterized protein n=1 Tax=Lentinula raphanica TaxID=153919 RepID=A0AA38UAX9_9AGAR|nr:hypothetical protein F5878DRAFT_663588 [Lentinula raphanica]
MDIVVDYDAVFATPEEYEDDVEDAEGVSLGSSDTNANDPPNDVDAASVEPVLDTPEGLRLPDPEDSAEPEAPTRPSSPLQLPLRSPALPVISRRDDSSRDDSKGAIHFSVRPVASLPPKPPVSRSSSSLITSPPSSLSTPSPSFEVPRGPGGRYSTSQKGKGRPKRATAASSSSSVVPASATTQESGPSRSREKAADRYARYDSNLVDVQLRLLALEQEIKSSAASLRLIEAKLSAATPLLNSAPSPSPSPIPSSGPASAPKRSLLERLSDDPVSSASPMSLSPEPEDLVPPPHKKPRLNPARSLSQAALLSAPAHWHLPSTAASIIHMIDRWRTLFATVDNSQLLPLPYSAQFAAQHRSSHDDDPIQIILFFDYGGLNMFLNIWNSHHSLLPELHDISIMRYSEE